MNRTKLGASIRAMGMDLTAARLMGVKSRAPTRSPSVSARRWRRRRGRSISATQPFDPSIGSSYTIRALVICVLGGLGSIRRCSSAGLLFGLIETIGSVVIGAGYKDAITFLVLVVLSSSGQRLDGQEYYR